MSLSLTFHWFLPTNGDRSHVVGGGHGTLVTARRGDRPPSVGWAHPFRAAGGTSPVDRVPPS